MKQTDDLVTKKYLDKKLRKFKDEIIGEFKKRDENKDVHNFSHARINEELDNHDRRITQLAAA